MIFKIDWIEDQINTISQEIKLINSLPNIAVHIATFNSIGRYLKNNLIVDFPDLLILDLEMIEENIEEGSNEYFIFNLFKKDRINAPCIIYTHNIHRKELKENYVIKNKYFLGCFQKGDQLEEFMQVISKLVLFPKHTIVHLSDIHFDSGNPKKQKELFKAFEKELEKINVDSLVITGDLANKKLSNDYELLAPILKNIFMKKFGSNYENNVFIIPGNHDLEWSDYKSSIPVSRPYFEYQNFISTIFSNSGFNIKSTNIDTCWIKKSNNIHFIGINSSIENIENKGNGVLTEEHESIIETNWINKPKMNSELRILLIHHNIFLPLSRSSKEEKRQMENGGVLFQLLLMAKCDLVLTGHTHLPYLVKFGGSNYLSGKTEFLKMKSFFNFSSGTFGGYSAGLDMQNYFSTIELIPKISILKNIEWNICFNSFQYESTTKTWEKSNDSSLLHINPNYNK